MKQARTATLRTPNGQQIVVDSENGIMPLPDNSPDQAASPSLHLEPWPVTPHWHAPGLRSVLQPATGTRRLASFRSRENHQVGLAIILQTRTKPTKPAIHFGDALHKIKSDRPRSHGNAPASYFGPGRDRKPPSAPGFPPSDTAGKETFEMQLIVQKIDKPEAINFILGQTHFIKSVEDIHETLVATVPGIQFGLAFCEASGKCLVRWSGTDPAMIELAQKNAQAIGAGHSFIIFLGDGYFPLNVLNAVKMVPEVCRIFCATANPTEVILAETEQGRSILGVVDGFCANGIEGNDDIQWRKNFLRQIGYKL